jgi:hypothetical protein
VALANFAPGVKISDAHGRPLRRDGRTVLPVFHPAVAARWPDLRAVLYDDFAVLGRLLRTRRKEGSGASQKGSG